MGKGLWRGRACKGKGRNGGEWRKKKGRGRKEKGTGRERKGRRYLPLRFSGYNHLTSTERTQTGLFEG